MLSTELTGREGVGTGPTRPGRMSGFCNLILQWCTFVRYHHVCTLQNELAGEGWELGLEGGLGKCQDYVILL